jgi:hypothetical protein
MTDWVRIEAALDEQSVAHTCAICGRRIPVGDEERWGIAARALRGPVTVTWVHAPCFVNALSPSAQRGFLEMPNAAPPT